jgi:hypothetical protein
MSNRYKASIFSSTAATSTSSAASGVWKLSDIAQAITAGLWPVVVAAGDALFNYVSLLLPFDSTNGKTNNTFLDSSTNNFTITRNGTATQGTFTPFSQTGWGGFFNGTTDYLTAPSNAAFAVGTVFTVELWVWPTTTTNMVTLGALGIGWNGASQWGVANVGVAWVVTSSTMPTQSAWNHIAIVRTGTGTNQTAVYLNGVSVAVGTFTPALTTSTIAYIGSGAAGASPLGGYMSNLRIVKGTAVYTTAFTPPTEPLTAITNTSLLTLQSNYFKDNSTNAFTITPSGTTSIQAFSPFLPTAAYDSATNGGTGFFNGTTDYVSAPDNAALELGSSDFTIEAWIYPTIDQFAVIVCKRASNVGNGPYTFSYALTTKVLSLIASADNTTTAVTVTGIAVTLNTWQHVAATRSGSNWTVWQNGVSTGTASYAGTIYATGTSLTTIGAFGNGANLFPGYVSGLRIVNGTAVYTANFTPPTAPLTAITNTSLLLSGTNAGAIDNASKNTAITKGSAQISTTLSKWGGSSLACPFASSNLTIPDSPLLRFGTGDFTVEGWFYLNFDSALRNIVSKGNSTTTGWTVGITSLNRIFATFTSTTITGTVATLAANTWYYFAFVRSGTATGNIKLYINGTLEVSSATAITTDFNQTDALYIGSNRTGTTPAFDGYLDDIRITKAARTVTTTPTAAFNLQ